MDKILGLNLLKIIFKFYVVLWCDNFKFIFYFSFENVRVDAVKMLKNILKFYDELRFKNIL